ncbi:MAG TPA: hypothetical protein DEP84_16445 [Chloroflexi bacterium]|nr:hypothetical protein [Chloroflexota bacterium]
MSAVTFERYTRRTHGLVGGFPQTSLGTALGPRLPVEGLWMVGDSIFPGQSTAGVTLGALRVVDSILQETPHRGIASYHQLPNGIGGILKEVHPDGHVSRHLPVGAGD